MFKNFSAKKYIYLILLYVIFLLLTLNVFVWIIDDLYIYFRYVNNFVRGNGIVYNIGERVEGFSSFSWFFILSFFQYLNMPLEVSSKIAGLVLAFLILIFFYKICLYQKLGKFSFLACALMLFNLPFILWSVSGFELMFYIFLLVLCYYKVLNLNLTSSSIIFLSLLIFLISVTRPEGILYSIAFIAFIYFNSYDKFFTLKIAFIYGILFSSFLLFRFFYFGDILPNTYYAKLGHNLIGYYELRTYKNGFIYLLYFFRDNPQFLLFIFLISLSNRILKSNKFFLFTFVLVLIQFFFIIFAGGDWMPQYRFVVIAIPFMALFSISCVEELTKKVQDKKRLFYISCSTLTLLIFLNLFLSDYNEINIGKKLWNDLKEYSKEMKLIIPENSLVANGSSGIIPYYLENANFLDIVGLTNKHIAKNGYRHGSWFEKSLPEYVYNQHPDWLIMWKKKNVSGDYTFENANPCYFDMAQNENFRKYSLFKTYDFINNTRIELYRLNDKKN